MATIYKVWVHIEKINYEKDFFEDIDLPESIGEFRSIRDARKFVEDLPRKDDEQ